MDQYTDKYLRVDNTLGQPNTDIELRKRGIVKTGRKPKSLGYKTSEQLDTTIDWNKIIGKENFTIHYCPNCGPVHYERIYRT